MKNLQKYIKKAIVFQNNLDDISINNNYNLAKFGTTKEVAAIVSKAKWDINGFNKTKKITLKEFNEWYTDYLLMRRNEVV